MNAPLSRFLVEFPQTVATPDFSASSARLDLVETVPAVTLTAEALAQQLEDAREAAAEETRIETESALSKQFEEERADMLRGFEAEREAWAKEQGEALNASLSAAVAQLETTISDALAGALRPLFAQALQARVLAELGLAVKALLSDPGHPTIRIEGPVDLLTAFGSAQEADLAIDYVVSEQAELTIVADGTRIATRLSACLARFSIHEG